MELRLKLRKIKVQILGWPKNLLKCKQTFWPAQQMCACVLSHFSHALLFVTLWTVACQAPLSMGFSRQEYWSGLPCPPPGDLPDPGIEPAFPVIPALQVDSSPLSHQETPIHRYPHTTFFLKEKKTIENYEQHGETIDFFMNTCI